MAAGTKTAIITGAAGGVGSALTRRLDALGYHLTLLSRNAEKLQKLASELSHKPELIVRDLDMDLIREVRDGWAFYRDRRPEAYGELVQS